jgi:mannose-6-phosphate isomerase
MKPCGRALHEILYLSFIYLLLGVAKGRGCRRLYLDEMTDVAEPRNNIHFITTMPPITVDDPIASLDKPFGGHRFALFPKIVVSGHAYLFLFYFAAQTDRDMQQDKNKVFPLAGKIQHYAWGGASFIPDLLSIPNPDGRPFAEYWMGAHDNASSELLEGDRRFKLNEYIQSFPKETLGLNVSARFGKLPYLMKILDVRDMLSIQVHPSKKAAEKAFQEENKQGIPLEAADRNYKDENHKPELMTALSDFWLLHGFKPAERLKQVLETTPELYFLRTILEKDGYQGLYRTAMEMPQMDVNEVLQPLLDRILPFYKQGRSSKDREDFWAARAALTFNETGRIDRGIFSIYLFNLVHLQPGEAIFQDAGVPHAYLEGQNVEIMANSDNVLRGGLTPKHIDVPELLKNIRFEATEPDVIHGKSVEGPVSVFPTPAPDFELSRIGLMKGHDIRIGVRSVQIFFVLEGKLRVEENPQNSFVCGMGDAFIAFDGATVELRASKGSIIYRAGVPVSY